MSHNTWLHRISRVVIVKPLMATRITPNQLTFMRLITGAIAAYLVALGGSFFLDFGGLLFLISMFLDRADGDLARMSGKTSSFGHSFDLYSDSFCNTILFVGLGIGLRLGEYGDTAIIMGSLAGLSVGGILILVIKLETKLGARAGELGNFYGFDPDDVMIVIPILIWNDFSEELLLAASIGAPLFLIFFYFLYKFKMIN